MIFVNVAALALLAAALSLLTRERVEKTLPLVMFVTILCLYVPALAGLMGAWLVWAWRAASVAALALAARHCAKRRGETPASWRPLLLTPGLLAFAVLAVFLWAFTRRCEPTQFDEFTHWALTVKDMFYRDRLSTDAQAATTFGTYPPGMALWQYLFARSLPTFSSGTLYFAHGLFLALEMMPLFARVRWRQAAFLPALTALVFLIPYLYFSPFENAGWSCVYIDRALALTFAYALMSYFLEEKKTPLVYLRTGLALAVLALLKSTGSYTAAIAALVILLDGAGRTKRARIADGCLLLLPWLAAVLSWRVHLHIMGTSAVVRERGITPEAVAAFLSGRAEPWLYAFSDGFFARMLRGSTDIPGVLPIPFVALPLVWLAFMLPAQRLSGRRTGRILADWAVFTVGFAGYMAALYVIYLFIFTQDETMKYTSLYRYASAYWLGVCVYAMVHLIDRAFAPGGKRLARCGAVAAALAFVLAVAPVQYAVSDLTLGGEARNKYYADHTGLYYLSRVKVRSVREWIGDGDSVYVLSCGEIKPWLIARYELLPNRVCTWDEWDFPGDRAAWSRMLADGAYDYVWVAYADEDFIGRCGASFEGGVSVDTLYQVHAGAGGETVLTPVFQATP